MFLLAFLATFPVAIPLVLVKNARVALHVSSAVAIGLLFVTGYAFGRIAARRPSVVDISTVALGSVYVGLTIALGG